LYRGIKCVDAVSDRVSPYGIFSTRAAAQVECDKLNEGYDPINATGSDTGKS